MVNAECMYVAKPGTRIKPENIMESNSKGAPLKIARYIYKAGCYAIDGNGL